MKLIMYFLAPILSALLLAIGIPNEIFHFGSPFFGIIACIPLYIGLMHTQSRKMSALMYGVMAASVNIFSSFWLIHFQDFAIFTLGASSLAYFCLGLPFGVWFFYGMRLPVRVRPFAFAAVFTLWEWFKSSGFVAYPWGTLSMTTVPLRFFIQIADITGVWGITALVATGSALLAEVMIAVLGFTDGFEKKKGIPLKDPLLFTVGLLLITAVYGTYQIYKIRVPEKNIHLAIIQQNTDPWLEGEFTENLAKVQKLTEKVVRSSAKKIDLILWSESSLIYGYDENQDFYRRFPFDESFTDFLARIDIPLLTGSPRRCDPNAYNYHNSVYLIAPDGTVIDTYAKIQLVCFAEYIPFIDNPWVKKVFKALAGFSSGWQPGTEYKTLPITTESGHHIRFAAPICFEDAFPALCAELHNSGSNLLINLTNDSWSKTDGAEYQHFAVAYYRALELRTPLVRATNSGYSAVVDPTGQILFDLPLFTADGGVIDVPIYPLAQTFYAQWKDWLPTFFLLIGLVWMCVYRFDTSFCRQTIVYAPNALSHIAFAKRKKTQINRCRIKRLIYKKRPKRMRRNF